jgi:hypothetical protein
METYKRHIVFHRESSSHASPEASRKYLSTVPAADRSICVGYGTLWRPATTQSDG